MKGYLRSLGYWAYCMERMFLGMFGTMLLIFAIYALLDEGGTNWYTWMINYIPMLGFIFPIAEGINMSNMQVPLVLSCGSTRKEAAWGVIIMAHVIMLQLWLLAVVGEILLPPVYEADIYLKVCGIFFMISCGIGNGLGAVILRFGSKAGMIIYIVVLVLIISTFGMINAFSGLSEVLSFISGAGVIAAGVIFDVIMAIAFYFGIRRYEVRI